MVHHLHIHNQESKDGLLMITQSSESRTVGGDVCKLSKVKAEQRLLNSKSKEIGHARVCSHTVPTDRELEVKKSWKNKGKKYKEEERTSHGTTEEKGKMFLWTLRVNILNRGDALVWRGLKIVFWVTSFCLPPPNTHTHTHGRVLLSSFCQSLPTPARFQFNVTTTHPTQPSHSSNLVSTSPPYNQPTKQTSKQTIW